MLTANPQLQLRTSGATSFHGHLDELASARGVEGRKRILLENLAVLVDAQELADIVA